MKLTGLAPLGAAALLLLSCLCSPTYAGDAAKAKRNLMSARSNAESGRWSEFDASMQKAAADMEGLSDAEKAPLLADIAALKAMVTKSVEEDVTKRLDRAAKAEGGLSKLDLDRAAMRLNSDEAKAYADPAVLQKLNARLASMRGGSAPAPAPGTPQTPTPAPATPSAPRPALTGDLAAAAARIQQARRFVEQNDLNFAENMVQQARKLMESASDAEKVPLLADIASLNTQIDAARLKAQRDEEYRRVDEQVGRYVRTAEESIRAGLVSDPEWIDKSETLLATHDVKTFMPPEQIKQYQARLDATRAKLKAHNKAVAIERSADTLKQLEERVAADPFKGADERTAHGIFTDLKTLSDRTAAEFDRVPKDDPEVKAVLDRVAAANAKIEAAAGKWALDKLQEQFAASWKYASSGFEGWEAEKLDPKEAERGRVEGLNKTCQAIRGSVYWLNSPETKQIIQKYKDNPVVAATADAARKTLDDAAAKLNDAFNAVLAGLERRPMPEREADRTRIQVLIHDAKEWFEGTKFQGPNVARATAIDTRWKAEVARIEKERAETLQRMTAAASAAWPGIEAAISADGSFNPAEADRWKGKTIKIKGYYNRTGWDFDAAYHYAADVRGVPVAGTFAPHVLDAFNDVQRKTHWGIDDHTGWDLIAVVEGKGQINRRVFTEYKDARTRELLFKTERYVPEPCVLIRIIGLHTGPLAVGPK